MPEVGGEPARDFSHGILNFGSPIGLPTGEPIFWRSVLFSIKSIFYSSEALNEASEIQSNISSVESELSDLQYNISKIESEVSDIKDEMHFR